MRDFINFLKEHHRCLDPTIALEVLFCGRIRPDQQKPGLEQSCPGFHPQGPALDAERPPKFRQTKHSLSQAFFPAMLRLLTAIYGCGCGRLSRNGMRWPVTSSINELELYTTRAGIRAVLIFCRMANVERLLCMEWIRPRCPCPG